ncbi:MarR family transcriptional regulator [Tissierella sp. Yu-01]|uniref:MarR family winged helix-turn-helix transcriptional regulator n=1 Tax=Tissierella sp. Yu-01 TaxID=3035694 RepID=UPI00240D475F|nr:MarR family transcriptional regulator [Tissierella sp. Yu-01]WFA09438.1 MarR family transcriptional regulator [Tissierella sp. Yu-01]
MESKSSDQVKNIEKYLRRIDYIIRIKGRAILNDLNLTIPQFTALQILINHGDMTIGELSQNMALACSTITDLIDRMEKSQLVVRQKDEKDRRVVRIIVLSKGYEIVEKVIEQRVGFLETKLNDFNDNEKQILDSVLSKLYEAIEE